MLGLADEHKAKIGVGNSKPCPPERASLISSIKKGVPLSEKARETRKITDARRVGVSLPAATIEAMKAAQKLRWAKRREAGLVPPPKARTPLSREKLDAKNTQRREDRALKRAEKASPSGSLGTGRATTEGALDADAAVC